MLMLSDFYGAFASASFALLGLWLVVVQIRIGEWRGSEFHVRQSYGIALHFVLPGVMSVAALIDPFDPAFWRISFAIVALGGAVILIMVRDRSGRPQRTAARAAYALAIVLYLAVAALAGAGGTVALRTEAFLLIALVFLGFNAAWLLLFEQPQEATAAAPNPAAPPGPAAGSLPEAQSP